MQIGLPESTERSIKRTRNIEQYSNEVAPGPMQSNLRLDRNKSEIVFRASNALDGFQCPVVFQDTFYKPKLIDSSCHQCPILLLLFKYAIDAKLDDWYKLTYCELPRVSACTWVIRKVVLLTDSWGPSSGVLHNRLVINASVYVTSRGGHYASILTCGGDNMAFNCYQFINVHNFKHVANFDLSDGWVTTVQTMFIFNRG